MTNKTVAYVTISSVRGRLTFWYHAYPLGHSYTFTIRKFPNEVWKSSMRQEFHINEEEKVEAHEKDFDRKSSMRVVKVQ